MSASDTPCPICRKPAAPRFRPFCSGRCADVDLQSWLTDRYAVPAEPDEERPDEADLLEISGQHRRTPL